MAQVAFDAPKRCSVPSPTPGQFYTRPWKMKELETYRIEVLGMDPLMAATRTGSTHDIE